MASPQDVTGAPLMVVFDLPEAEHNESTRLIDGAAAQLFDRMLNAVGLERSAIAMTGLALARPATGQVPAADMARLAEITRHHIALLAPERVMLLGDAVNRALFGPDSARMRGRLHAINHQGRQFPSIASYHPRFLLKRPAAKADSWKHLQLLFWGE
nr:uracil-DNA glycosylase family protein [Stakelama flava]